MNPFRSFFVKLIIGLLGCALAVMVAGDVVYYFMTGGERLFLFEEEEGAAQEAAEEEYMAAEAQETAVLDNAQKAWTTAVDEGSAAAVQEPEPTTTAGDEGSAAAVPEPEPTTTASNEGSAAAVPEQTKENADGEPEKAEAGPAEAIPPSERMKGYAEAESEAAKQELAEADNTQKAVELSEDQILKPAGLAWNMRTESGDAVGEGLAELMYAEEHEVSYPLMPMPPEDGLPDYYIRINRAQNCATVYARDEAGEYTIPYKALLCSTGRNNRTPLGTFPLKERYRWRCMLGGVWSQYATRVYRGVLIHSVPYYTKNPGNLEVYQYNRLGEQASAGCIRMNVRDAKWVFDHCREGTLVEIYDDAEDPGPLGKPEPLRIEDGAEHPGWDPTDPEYPD